MLPTERIASLVIQPWGDLLIPASRCSPQLTAAVQHLTCLEIHVDGDGRVKVGAWDTVVEVIDVMNRRPGR